MIIYLWETINNNLCINKIIYLAGMGAFYMFLNGAQVDDHILDPPQTVYSYRVLYSTFDITPSLRAGINVIGVMLGNYKFGYTDVWCNMTMANGPRGCQTFIAFVNITYEDGSSYTYTSNIHDWVGRNGPVVWDHLFHGETFDARLNLTGWDSVPLANFSPAVWFPTVILNPPTSSPIGNTLGQLYPNNMPPIRIDISFSVVRYYALGPDWFFDFGQNMAGFVSLQLSDMLPSGTTLYISHAELLTEDESLNDWYCVPNPNAASFRMEPCFPHQTYGPGHFISDRYVGDFNCANMTNIFIAKGQMNETYTPLFSFAGFRYVRISGLPENYPVMASMLTAHFAHTDVENVGLLKLPVIAAQGDLTNKTPDILNRIHGACRFSQSSNLWSIPTDCPQRERRG